MLTDDLQVHLLELPKYNSDAQTVVQATALEKWAYFFRNAAQLTPDEIAGRLTDAEFVQAAGVLEMIARTPRENELYKARLKMERDEAARLDFAKDEGRVEGLERGQFVGRIQVLQHLLGLPESPMSELAETEIGQLSRLAGELQTQLRERR